MFVSTLGVLKIRNWRKLFRNKKRGIKYIGRG